MPGFDGTGPRGMGPMTGGGRGWCNPYGPLSAGGWAAPGFGGYGAPFTGYVPWGGYAQPYPMSWGGYGMAPFGPASMMGMPGPYAYGPYGLGYSGMGFGRGPGMGFGRGLGMGFGRGMGMGFGRGMGMGRGMGRGRGFW